MEYEDKSSDTSLSSMTRSISNPVNNNARLENEFSKESYEQKNSKSIK